MTAIIDTLPSDVLRLVCEELWDMPVPARLSLGPLASTCVEARTIALPLLMRTVTIRDKDAAETQLQDMLANNAVMQAVRTFNFVPRHARADQMVLLCPALIQVLEGMEKLREFRFEANIDPDDFLDHLQLQDLFLHRDADRTPRFQLPGVKKLSVQDSCAFLLGVFPEVRYVALTMTPREPHYDVSLCGKWPIATNVQYLCLGGETLGLEPEICELITSALPNVTTFVFEQEGEENTLPHFSGFKRIEKLVVPEVCGPVMRCGNFYLRLTPEEVKQHIEAFRQEARSELADFVLQAFPRLRTLWIGRKHMCDLTRMRRDELDNLIFENVLFIPAWEYPTSFIIMSTLSGPSEDVEICLLGLDFSSSGYI